MKVVNLKFLFTVLRKKSGCDVSFMQKLLSYMSRVRNITMLIFALCGVSLSAYGCTAENAFTANPVLQGGQYGIFSAGQDMSVGTVLRLQRLFGVPQAVICSPNSYLKFTTEGGTLYNGSTTNIYQTGVDGLGVRFKVSGSPGIIYGSETRYQLSGGTIPNNIVSVDVEFIIMGPLSPGVVNSSAFPVLKIIGFDYDQGNSLIFGKYNFSGGSFIVQQPTCTTPDYTYDLLRVGLTSFTGERQNSPWIDTPIKLTNCPTFYGNNSNGSRTFTNVNGGNAEELGTKQPVVLSLSLTPNAGTIDSQSGIIGLDSAATATGVGIQIGYLTGRIYTPQNLASAVSLNTTTGTNTPVYTFPFGARMVRTTGVLAPGNVSSSMTYTVTYK